MAQNNQKRRYGYTDGSLAYDLDALVRERALEEAGRPEPQRAPEPAARPQRRPAARPAARLSPLTVMGTVVVTVMAVAVLLGYVQLTKISANVTEMKDEISALQEEHVSLLTAYERTFDMTTIKETAEAAGMKKPTSGQIEYVELPSSNRTVVYQAEKSPVLENAAAGVKKAVAAVVEYFR